ncbi:MAG: response regulator [Myxococcota bacterium]
MATQVAPPPAARVNTRTITIVDDDPDTQRLLRITLELEGYGVATAANGLELLGPDAHKPDLFLLDVMLSWMDGFDLCRAIKRNPVLKDVPVIFVSGRDSPHDVRRGLECGAADYFTKPFDIEKLTRRIRELVDAPAQARSA